MKNLIRKLIPNFFISWYHLKLAFWGAVFYGFPSTRLRQGFGGQEKLKVIGVTGTNGKSTVVHLTTKILEQAGFSVASLSSIKFKIRDREWQNDLKMTMPGRFKLQKFLSQAVKANCQYAVLEVTSEGIKQHRHRFIDFDGAIFTNLTPEHIEAHGSFEKYKKAKGELFQRTKKVHIVNLDDESTEYFLQFPAGKKLGYTLEKSKYQNPNVKSMSKSKCQILEAHNYQLLSNGIKFSIENTNFYLNLLGEFNVYNALAAICVGLSQGVNLETCKRVLEKVEGIPGRMEVVIRGQAGVRPGSDPTVIVDYAHTPDSLRKVYETLLSSKSKIKNQKSKIICVLGACGGGRDKWKRPEMGKIAAQFCDQIILTNEDPYDENPGQIIEEISQGALEEIRVTPRSYPRLSASIYKILNRREAIREALKSAQAGDIVIITGKGCEPWMCVEKGRKIPWDDREVVREEFKKISE